MTTTVKQLTTPAALTSTLTTTLYTVPFATTTILKELTLCNTDTVPRLVTIYVGPGNVAGNTLLSALTVAAGETKIFTFSTVLVAADTIKGGASAASVVAITASGVEVIA